MAQRASATFIIIKTPQISFSQDIFQEKKKAECFTGRYLTDGM